MAEQMKEVEAEARSSPIPVAVTVAVCGALLAWASGFLISTFRLEMDSVVGYWTLLLGLSIAALFLSKWRPGLGRWFTVMAVVAAIVFPYRWLAVPGLLALLATPVGLAAAVIGPRAALVVALGCTGILLAPAGPVRGRASVADLAVALAAVWASLGVALAILRPARALARWSWQHYSSWLPQLEETRGRKAELESALSDLANANRQLKLAGERMAALRLIAEDAQRTKTAFVAKVSHEFRTPLNLIVGLVELMFRNPQMYHVTLPPDMENDLRVVHRNCAHLSSLIDDVLDLTRIESGRMTLYREWVDLVEIVGAAVEVVRPLVEKKGLSLTVRAQADVPAVFCDRTRIRQVVLNLLSNAARFTEKGGIELVVDLPSRDRVRVRVTDTGPGVAPEDTEKIFLPFCQAGSQLWRDRGGSGLGLTVSQQFISVHQGRMWLESELGVGSSFVFELPVSPSPERVSAPGRWIRRDWIWREDAFRTERSGEADRPRRPRLVVCDTTGGLAAGLERYPDKIDLAVATDLGHAIRAVGEYPSDAIVVNASAREDLMPLIDRARREAADTPVIGCVMPAQTGRAVSAGAVGYLVKPVSRDDVEQAIRGLGRPVKRVLVVDDDPDLLRLFERMLSSGDGNLQVETAASGRQALERLETASFDLMLLDVLMPDLDGWSVLEQVRAKESTQGLPVFLVSARDPTDQPLVGELLLATMEGGLSPAKLLSCSLALSGLLLTPDGQLG
jgi:signal transduction histidine kinase/CheY-like chemotaxis protein